MTTFLLILLTVVQILTAYCMGSFWGGYVRTHQLSQSYLFFIIPAIILHALVFTKLRRWLLLDLKKGT